MQRNPALIASVCTLLVSILFAAGLSLAAPSSAHLPSVQVTLASGDPPAPLDVQVEPGAAVVWRNDDTQAHRLRSVDGSWRSPVIAPGSDQRQVFVEPGRYPFVCDFDPGMSGMLTVQPDAYRVFLPLVIRSAPGAQSGERWSNPATWGGRVPQSGDAVTIPAGKVVLLDVSPPPLQSLTIEGELVFDRRDLDLTVGWIMLHGQGRLRIGTPTEPFAHRATITLNAPNLNEDVMGMGTRGILLMGGSFEAYGVTPNRVWTKLNDHAAAGATTLTLSDTVNWQPGAQIVIAPTDFYGVAETERHTAQAVNGAQVTLATPLQTSRWGRLQYVSSTGLTTTPTTEVTPLVLDERAEVGLLSRQIVIQGADDARWRNDRFGAQIMVMGTGVLRLDGVELRRVGQGGRLGRYPIHFHLLSYAANGSLIGDATQQLVANSSIWNSANRCMTIHGTNGTTIRNNICYDIAGHAIFVEDAVERRNLIENNLVLKVRQPPQPILPSDREGFLRGPSGFWLTNPDNIVRGNVAADAAGNGFWLAFPERPLGLNKLVPLRPINTQLGVFSHNVAHSNNKPGINLDFAPFDDAGNTRESKYVPTSDGGLDRYSANRVRFTFSDITTYKNRDNGLWNRTSWPDYVRFVSADNAGMFFAGAGDNGRISDSLIVGVSLNNSTPPPTSNQPNVAVASYHSTFDIAHNVIVNFPLNDRIDRASGAFATNDYYTSPVDRGLIRNPGNRLINSHPGRRVISPNINTPVGNAALAGALWDPHGYWGPAGNYWVYDIPFLTAGRTCMPVAGEHLTRSCTGPYYGVSGFRIDGSDRYKPVMPLTITRLDHNMQPIGAWIVEDGSSGNRNTFNIMSHMRHFAAVPDGRYRIEFRDHLVSHPLPTQEVMLVLSNMHSTSDRLILSVPFSGSATIQAYLTTRELYWDIQAPNTPVRHLTPVGSFAALLATENSVWQDHASQQVWVNVSGGLALPGGAPTDPLSDEALYRATYLRIFKP